MEIIGRRPMFWPISNGYFLSEMIIVIGSPSCCFDLIFHVRFTEALRSFSCTLPISNQLLPTSIGFSVGDYRDCAPQLCPSWPVILV